VRPRWNVGIVENGWVDAPQSTRWLAAKLGLRKAKRLLLEPSYQDYRDVRRYVAEHFADAKDSIDVTPLTRSLIELHESGAIDHDELIAFGLEFIFAASEAPTAMLSGMLLHIAASPANLEHLRRDHAAIEPFIEEVLRFETPGQWLRRVAVDEIAIEGTVIPKGAALLALISSANRDSGVFPGADEFRLGRSPNPHIAFGMGPHGCPGARLARLQARVFLEELTTFVGSVQLQDPGAPTEYQWLFAIRSLTRLNLALAS
jgi:hypothetical protein